MNTKIAHLLAGAVAASALIAPASAAEPWYAHSNHSYQNQMAAVYAILNLDAKWVGGDIRGSSTAVGNNISTSNVGNTWQAYTQLNMADTGAEINAKIKHAGSVDLSSTAICNNISSNVDGATDAYAITDQRCATTDPWAHANVTGIQIGGDFAVTAAAVGNNAAFSGDVYSYRIQSLQANAAAVNAVVNVNAYDVGGNVDVSATAIGNNFSIKQTFGAP